MMSRVVAPGQLHDVAAQEIAAWRGRCLNLFARGERAIAMVLEVAHANGSQGPIRHLAGQRLSDVSALCTLGQATAKQQQGFTGALDQWTTLDGRRPYLSHGVAVALTVHNGLWHAKFDFRDYRKSGAEERRWTVSEDEAGAFEASLEESFKKLSAQLGQLRKMLSA